MSYCGLDCLSSAKGMGSVVRYFRHFYSWFWSARSCGGDLGLSELVSCGTLLINLIWSSGFRVVFGSASEQKLLELFGNCSKNNSILHRMLKLTQWQPYPWLNHAPGTTVEMFSLIYWPDSVTTTEAALSSCA